MAGKAEQSLEKIDGALPGLLVKINGTLDDVQAVVNDARRDPRFYAELDRGSGFTTRSILAVPLNIRERAIGVVEIINKRGRSGFDSRDEEIATALAAQAAVAIDNARLYKKLADTVVESRMSYRL
jgi:GAF domain-containing protein